MVTEKSISQISDLWKEEKRQFVKKSTFAAYSLIVETHLLPAFGHLTAVTEKDVQDFVLHKLNGGLSQKTIKDMLMPTEPRTYRNYYKKLLVKLDIPPIKFHGLRHSFATRCIESHCDYKTVSVILGHSNISTTLNLYVHPNYEQKKKCIDKMLKSLK